MLTSAASHPAQHPRTTGFRTNVPQLQASTVVHLALPLGWLPWTCRHKCGADANGAPPPGSLVDPAIHFVPSEDGHASMCSYCHKMLHPSGRHVKLWKHLCCCTSAPVLVATQARDWSAFRLQAKFPDAASAFEVPSFNKFKCKRCASLVTGTLAASTHTCTTSSRQSDKATAVRAPVHMGVLSPTLTPLSARPSDRRRQLLTRRRATKYCHLHHCSLPSHRQRRAASSSREQAPVRRLVLQAPLAIGAAPPVTTRT